MTCTVATIVEGHGEVRALPVLLRRIAEDVGRYDLRTPPPFRLARTKPTDRRDLERACRVVAARVTGTGGVLIVMDADDDCPVTLAERVGNLVPALSVPVCVVIANREFESIFLAASGSLAAAGRFTGKYDGHPPEQPRGVKELVRRLMAGGAYSETLEQAALFAALELVEARDCRWYRKLESDVRRVLGV